MYRTFQCFFLLVLLTFQTYKLSTLPNGIKVATNPDPGHFSAAGIYVDAGSRYETEHLKGCSHLMDRLAFKSTANHSGQEMLKTLELLGGNYQCLSAREALMYQAAVFNSDIEKVFSLLSETVKCPNITFDELEEQKRTVDYEVAEIWRRPDLLLPEILHGVAYSGETLGNPLICPTERIPEINNDLINEYRNKLYNPESITLAFIGIDHEKSLELADKYMGDMKQLQPKLKPVASHYTGGSAYIESLQDFDDQFSHFFIAFEGLSYDDPDAYALSVLQTLLGGGGSFSAGGPGKGMYSRVYLQVLNQYHFVENCVAFNHSYTDSGLFGFSISGLKEASHLLPEIVCDQLVRTMTEDKSGLTKTEVERAKKQFRSQLLMNLESRMVQLEDLGRQVQTRGKKLPLSEIVHNIDKLTVDDIRRVAVRVLTGNANNPGKGTGRPSTVSLVFPNELDVSPIVDYFKLGKK